MKFKIIPEDEPNTQTIVLKTDPGPSNSLNNLDGIIGNWVSEQLRKSLEKKEDKKEDKPKAKTFTTSELLCWSFILMCSAPWTGQWIIHALDNAKIQWAQILLNAVPK